ncbi:MAG: hypothetical protein ABI629_04170 [bacterium]
MRRLALLALALLLAGCVARTPSWQPTPFITTFWCAPPLDALDDARAAQIAAAGFTTIGAPCQGDLSATANRRVLATAARHGLRMWVADHRLYAAVIGGAEATAQVQAAVDDYRDLPALDGYVLADEPTTAAFASVATAVAALRRADPARLAYVNLLPDYVPPPLLGAESYDDYLQRFASEVRPQLLSVDYYPFGATKDRSTFFANLAALRSTALRHDLPFLWIVLAMPHGPYRDPTEAELAWQVFHALAYGARGISYFTYWTPPDRTGEWQHRNGIIANGEPTPRYAQVTRLNRIARALGAALAGWRSLAIADGLGEIGAPWPIGPIAGLDGGPITTGLFGDRAGGIAALLVNRDYRTAITAHLQLRDGAAWPEVFDPASERWRRAAGLDLPLPAGEAVLLRWPAS